MNDEVDFLHVDKHESFLQVVTMNFDGGLSSILKVPKIASFQCLYNISKKKLEMKLIFLLGSTPFQAEQPPQGMELQEKETQKD